MLEYLNSIYPLKTRLLVGVTFFVVMGLFDYMKNPQNPKRAKEYLFIAFFPDIVILAVQASYWVGLLIGVICATANNPRRNRIQLRYLSLYKKLLFPLNAAIFFASVGCFLAFVFPPYFSIGGESVLRESRNFEVVAYIHWGTYIGALLGAFMSVYSILKDRKILVEID